MKTQRLLLSLNSLLFASPLLAVPHEPVFKVQDIDTSIQIGYGIAIADVNGDGKPDILLADQHTIQWYENPTWTKHVMVENVTERDNVCIAAQDIDGDGKAEVAIGAQWTPAKQQIRRKAGASFISFHPRTGPGAGKR